RDARYPSPWWLAPLPADYRGAGDGGVDGDGWRAIAERFSQQGNVFHGGYRNDTVRRAALAGADTGGDCRCLVGGLLVAFCPRCFLWPGTSGARCTWPA